MELTSSGKYLKSFYISFGYRLTVNTETVSYNEEGVMVLISLMMRFMEGYLLVS